MPGTGFAQVQVFLTINAVRTDITSYVRLDGRDGIRIEIGQKDNSGGLRANTCRMKLDNRDGRFTPSNQRGAYYPYIKRNMRIEVVTNNGGASSRFFGEVSEWPTRFDDSGNDCWAPIVASSQTRRLLKGPVESTMRQYVMRQPPYIQDTAVEYWPLEEASGAKSFGSAMGGSAMTGLGAVTAAGSSAWPGSQSVVSLGAGSVLSAQVRNYTQSGTSIRFLWTMPAFGSDVVLMRADTTSLNCVSWEIVYRTGASGGLTVKAYDDSGTELLADSNHAVALDGKVGYLALKLLQSGADIVWSVDHLQAVTNSEGYYLETASPAGPAGTLASRTAGIFRSLVFNPTGATLGAGIGHVTVGSDSNATQMTSGAMFGYPRSPGAGVTAAAAISRVAVAAGSSLVTSRVGPSPTLVGSQPVNRAIESIKSYADADGGLLSDSISGAGFEFTDRSYLYYTASTVLTLNQSAGNLPAKSPPEVEYDDSRLVSQARISRTGGGTVSYVTTRSEGVFEESKTIQLDNDGQLMPAAEWAVNKGGVQYPKIPAFGVDLSRTANSALIAQWLALKIGDRVAYTNPHSNLYKGSLDYTAYGWSEWLNFHDWDATLNVGPTLENSASGVTTSLTANNRAGQVAGASVVTAATSTATALTVTSYSGYVWTQTSGDRPFDCIIDLTGEVVTVTNTTGGGTGVQTFTVTRSVNGIVAAIPTGSIISLLTPFIVAR